MNHLEDATMDKGFITDLPVLTLIEINGADAIEFLHGQFTSDVAGLASGKAALSAWCDPKGRTIATFILARLDDRFWLLMPESLSAAFMRRLQMYVLRADVNIVDLGQQSAMIGIVDASLNKVAALHPGLEINQDQTVIQHEEYTFISCLTGILIVIANPTKTQEPWRAYQAHLPHAGRLEWELANIRKGLPWLGEQTSGLFLPQELNLDALDALAHDKGCYPGQEIIARLRFRGQVKRRLCYVSTDNRTILQPGARLAATGGEKNIGTVVNSALDAKQELLIVLDRSLMEAGQFVGRLIDGELPDWPINVEYEINSGCL